MNNSTIKWVLTFLLFILSVVPTYALNSTYEDVKYTYIGNNVIITHTIIFQSVINYTDINLSIPDGAKAILVTLDGQRLESPNRSVKELTYEYVVSNDQTTDKLLIRSAPLTDAKKYVVKAFLDEGVFIRSDLGGSIIESVFPYPTQVSSNGVSIILSWEFIDVDAFDEKAFYILINKNEGNSILFAILFSAIILVVIGTFIYYFKIHRPKKSILHKTKIISDKTITNTKKASNSKNKTDLSKIRHNIVLEHLKEDEKRVINILKQKNGECEQGTIRFLGNFSKATLSRILMELEERKIINKEQKGKKNIIKLK